MHCHIHHTNNCIECALERQTKEIVSAINGLRVSTAPKARDSYPARVIAAIRARFGLTRFQR